MLETSLPAGTERRREDIGLITGTSGYTDDLATEAGRPTPLHMAVVRSPYAHAEIIGMQLDAAQAVPGVVGAFSSAELVGQMRTMDTFPVPGLKKPARRPLALGRARYVGDPVAVVLAETRYSAVDARDLIEVDYAPLQAVADPEAALGPEAAVVYEEFGTNLAFLHESSGGDLAEAFREADQIVRLRLVNQRLAPSSIEGRACLFDYDPATGMLTGWVSSQAIFRAREMLSSFLGLDRSRIHLKVPEVGGAFGVKTGFVGEEIVAAALAIRLERPVKWIEGRSENLQAQTQGRGQINYVEAAVKSDGQLLGLRVRSVADLGAFLAPVTAMVPTGTSRMLAGPYRIKAFSSQVAGALNNKVPTAAYRGAGRPEAAYILERTMDRIARELGLDPAEVRRRNFIPAEAFPYDAPTGVQYDSGNYELALDRALELADYTGLRATQQTRRAEGSSKMLGIGLSSYIEIAGGGGTPLPGMPQEAATVRVRSDGTILVQSGVAHNGQGHFTAFAGIAAGVFGLSAGQVEVQMGDTALPAYGIGTFGSRTTPIAASTILLAAQAVRAKVLGLAARLLEAAEADLVLEAGRVSVRGVPGCSIELGELARRVEAQPDLIDREPPNPVNGRSIEGLAAWRDFVPGGATFPSGTHLAVVEVDTETGDIAILKYVAVDDCGRVLNHYLADAQVHGGLAQGIGQALYEEVVYDGTGQLISGTLMDYTLPTAEQVPVFLTDSLETPSPHNPLGAKGVGEAGCTGGPPAIVNAVLDALAPLGIQAIDMPLRPEKIWQIVQAARAGRLDQTIPAPPPVFPQSEAEQPAPPATFVFE